MNKKKRRNIAIAVICILLVVVIDICVFTCVMYKPLCKEFSIPEFSDNGNIVYTPGADHLPRKFHVTIFCIDEYIHWVYKLNEEEQKAVLTDIEKGNWTLLNEDIYWGIKEFDGLYGGGEILSENLLKHECYVCVYDPNQEQIITNKYDDYYYFNVGHSAWAIYLYDTETCKYYCMYATI